MENYKIKIINTLDELYNLKKEWDSIINLDLRDGFFKSWDWQVCWYKHFAESTNLHTLRIEDDKGCIKGIIPLSYYKIKLLPGIKKFNLLGFMGREVVSGDYLSILAKEIDKPLVMDNFLEWLIHNKKQHPLLLVGEILQDDPICSMLQNICKSNGMKFYLQEPRICPFIELPKSYDSYLKTLSSNFRQQIMRKNRHVFNKLNGEIVISEQENEFDEGLEDLFELQLKRWHTIGISCTFENTRFRLFIKDICKQLVQKKMVRLYRLFLQGKSAAAILMFYWGDTAIFYQSGWDPVFKKYSPGAVLLSNVIKDAINAGKRYFDFLRGDEPYKFKWTNDYRSTISILLSLEQSYKILFKSLSLKDKLKRMWIK